MINPNYDLGIETLGITKCKCIKIFSSINKTVENHWPRS